MVVCVTTSVPALKMAPPSRIVLFTPCSVSPWSERVPVVAILKMQGGTRGTSGLDRDSPHRPR